MEKDRENKRIPALTAKGFGAVLVATGVGALVLPPSWSPMSAAVPYALFHIAFGLLGVALGLRGLKASRAFCVGFGLIDLYQAVASRQGWFPGQWFHWRPADDAMHWAIGAALIVLGLL